METRHFDSFDGTSLAYRDYQGGDAIPLVCCSGIACDEMYWIELAPELASTRRVVTWDYPYHGETGPAGDPDEITVNSLARHGHHLANHLGIDNFSLIGHSMGVQVALEMYRQDPGLLRSLIMVAGPYQHTVGHLYGTGIGQLLLTAIELGADLQPDLAGMIWKVAVNRQLTDPLARAAGLIGSAPAEKMARYFEHLAGMDLQILVRMFKEGQEHSADDLLDQISVPTLILHGTKDFMTPVALAEEMARRISKAEFVAVEGGAHTLPIEDPDFIAETVGRFLKEND